jgi:deferrochelatase/peroxidase EfeB
MSNVSVPIVYQRALRDDAGRFRSALTFTLRKSAKHSSCLETLATLLAEVDSPELRDAPLRILLGVAPQLLHEHPEWPKLARDLDRVQEKPSNADVFVQIAAETEDERVFALRLVKRVLDAKFQLTEQIHGVRRSFGAEPFGYRHEGLWTRGDEALLSSAEVPGASWLLFLPCVQDLKRFFEATTESQDSAIGRERQAPVGTPGKPGSHIDRARQAQGGDPSRLSRRSFSYECYEEAGTVFIATAARPEFLAAAEQAMLGDPLMEFTRVEAGGLFFVPPSAKWLAPEAPLVPLENSQRPWAERVAFPARPLVLYEMTPLTRAFFVRCFHNNRDNFGDAEHLRGDLLLLSKGLAKMIYGGHLSPDSRFRKLLELAFRWDNSEPFRRGDDLLVEKVMKLRRDAASEQELALARAELRASLASNENCRRAAGELAEVTVQELLGDLILDDAEFSSAYPRAHQEDFETLFTLCEAAAAEGREVNKLVGTYMTIVC